LIAFWKKLLSLLDPTERRRGAAVFGLLVVVAFFQTVGVASIMPFVAVLTNPEMVDTNPYLTAAFDMLGFQSTDAFLVFLGLVFFLLLVTSLVFQGLGQWAQLRFSHNRIYTWGARLIGGYLRQPYEWFLNRHSADLATAVLAEVNLVVHHALFPAMRIVASGLVAMFLLGLLLAVDPLLAAGMVGFLGLGYALVYFLLRVRLRRIGHQRKRANEARFHVTQEAFGGIKELKISGLEEVTVQRFLRPSKQMAGSMISAGIISEIPTLAMQGLLFGSMLLALVYLVAVHGSVEGAIPVIALYALAGYRLMPAIKEIYRDLAQLKFNEPALDALVRDFATLQTQAPESQSDSTDRTPLTKTLALRDVTYAYPGASRAALSDVSVTVPVFSTVGLVGSTGSGKTTVVDVILGLLRPASGTLVVDGQEINDDAVRRWQRSLGYVPQQIFLSDDTVAANIAFGLPPEMIDMAAVEAAARVANLHDFVAGELPEGYQTKVGERGVRLSGGQRQRIGIARALYHDPDVLIMDEATSALDNITERAVMEAVHNLANRKTLIIIAHRLSTVRNCDRIYLLELGRVVASGKYDELVAHEARFRAMTESA
jgi:ATP-binding cassette, subfamily B, bacterial PglK